MTIISNTSNSTQNEENLLITKLHLNPFSLGSVKCNRFGKNVILYSAGIHYNYIIII